MIIQRFSIALFLLLFIGQSVFGQESLAIDKHGIYLGLNGGTWFPDNKNKILGNPPIIGMTFDFRFPKNSVGLSFDIIGWPKGRPKEPLIVKFGDSTITTNDYGGAHLTIDYSREFFETKRFVFEGMCGIGYGDFTYYNPDKDTDIHKASFIFSPGISMRYVIGKDFFVQVKLQYCIADYRLKDNVTTDLKGNYFTAKLIIGGIVH